MTSKTVKPVRCAIYTRVSTEAGLEQDFNSLDAQYDAAQAYIRSQAHAGWTLIRTRYDDGGYSGGSTERPALQRLLADVKARKVQIIVVYKVDRLTRSLAETTRSRGCAVSTSRNCRPDGTRHSGGGHPLTCPATCCFVSWLIGCKPIGSANWMPTVDVCLTASGRGRPMRPTGLWLTSTDPEPS